MRTRYIFSFFIYLLLFVPLYAKSVVLINEIAWMGNAYSANDEWIELKNTGDESVGLTGWTIVAGDGVPLIKLTGTSTSGGFFLLERTDDDSVAGVVADQIYTGALSNTGESLLLRNAFGETVDSVEASKGWPAGSNNTKDSMQRSGLGWITAPGTPRAQNAKESVPVYISPPAANIISRVHETPSRQALTPASISQETKSEEEISSTGGIMNKLALTQNIADQSDPTKDESGSILVSRAPADDYVWLLGSVCTGALLGGFVLFVHRRMRTHGEVQPQ